VRALEQVWIPLSDGCRLAARIWLPADAESDPVPAILEYLPYRKNDATAVRDAIRHPYFAGNGYASVRVDIRGSGDSDGTLMDEYLPLEQDDAVEVIGWLGRQPWCTGKVGMIGLSWGGFAGLQVAARRPAELGAVVSLGTTHDRYLDDIHYTGGCVYQPFLGWGATMLAYNARPPDPAVVGERWRQMWIERMEQNTPFDEAWLSHQRYDDYWKHGSVRECLEAIACPVYVVSGWADWYRNPVLALLEGLRVPRKGLIGPWGHVYPEEGVPGPAIGFLQECLRWWDQWLKGIDTGVMDEPMLCFWMPEPLGPGMHPVSPGRWVAEPRWPSPNVETHTYTLDRDGLSRTPGEKTRRRIRGLQTAGAETSGWVTAPDQRDEDLRWLCFDSAPFEQRVEIFGLPHLTLSFLADRPKALVAVRLCDVAPGGDSTLLTRGVLNLTHRDSHERPEPLEPGKVYSAGIRLDLLVGALLPGHRLRLALSPTYWPRVWPSPEPVTLTILAGPDSRLELPIRWPRPEDDGLRPFEPPEGSPPLSVELLDQRSIETPRWEPSSPPGVKTRQEVAQGYRFGDGLLYSHSSRDEFSIVEDEPLSARARSGHTIVIARDDWHTRVESTGTLTADGDSFHLVHALEGYEAGVRVFAKTWTRTIPRDLV
jgi:uncharacterized protein